MFTSCTCTCVDHKHREIRGDWEKGGGVGGGEGQTGLSVLF